MAGKHAVPHKPVSVQLSPQDQQMLAALGRAGELSKQSVVRFSIDMLHAHMKRARLDFPDL